MKIFLSYIRALRIVMITTVFVVLMTAITLMIVIITATQYNSCKTNANRDTKVDKMKENWKKCS